MRPDEIEKKSMSIIAAELGERHIPEECLPVVLRVIHATADFDFADNLVFSEGAVRSGLTALTSGISIVTDTHMAASGINKKAFLPSGGEVRCYVADDDVADEARKRGVTRSLVAMERAAEAFPRGVFAIGNAPTALLRLCELIDEGVVSPSLVIGVPVGFVNVVESKETLLKKDVPRIVARGRKGGSTVAAAIVNALLFQATGQKLS